MLPWTSDHDALCLTIAETVEEQVLVNRRVAVNGEDVRGPHGGEEHMKK